ncbi:ABC transporter ATP-binding protein [Microbacterium sp. STN6]|uniref:ABC transporter ATP-binding protein n=1 Tax=Microbacterium sp. STN6 TaxID=2995588 RepID=UPI002260F1AC|nr:ABC transporter ATP-binding protein [Microbacterium sp. STN6]MCX7521038.1 ABC transporter ATP-binding protein [Microbacterium sp. STN6]
MLRAVRLSLSFMAQSDRLRFFALLTGRTLSGLLDVFGVAMIGVIASVATTALGPSSSKPATVLGVEMPFAGPYALVWLAAIVLAVFVFKSLLALFLSRRLAFLIARVEARNATAIGRHLLHGSLDDVKRYSKAEYQFAITGSSTAAFTGLLNGFSTIISEGFLLVLISAAFFFVDFVAAVFALVYFALVGVCIQLLIGRSLKRAGQEASRGSIDTVNLVGDSIDTFRELSVMGKQDFYLERLHTARSRLSDSGATSAFLSGMPRYIVETALIVGVVALVAQQLLTNGLVSGATTLGVFLTGGMRIMASLLPLQSALGSIKMNAAQATLACAFLAEQRKGEASEAYSGERARAQADADAALPGRFDKGLKVALTHAGFTYTGTSQPALSGVSLTAESGQFTAIIGPSGAGKTTVVDVLLGLFDPSAGAVAIDGVEPSVLRRVRPGAVSYVPQRPGIVSGTIAENIALGISADQIDRKRLAQVVRDAFLTDFIDALPDGVDTSVGHQANSLSGGQIQRIGLARALYPSPRLLIMDEATSALDASSEAFISETLRRLHGQVTVVVIAHRLSTVQHADVVYLLEGGQVTASGTFAELRSTNPIVAEYVKLMSFDDQPVSSVSER